VKHNVLVFPCGSEIGLEIYRSIEFSTHFNVYGGSSVDDHGEYVYKNYIGGIPRVEDPNFVEALNEIIKDNKIKFIIPAHDSVVLKLAQAEAEANLDCQVITSPLPTCDVARSKTRTYNEFEAVIATPTIYKEISDIPETAWPIFMKPDVGQGSKGTHLAKNFGEAQFHIKHADSPLILLEFLPGKEYTVDCFTDKNGVLTFAEGRERIRVANGISVASATVDDPRFGGLANKINEKLVFNGAWFFQVKKNKDGDLVLMEIAPRIAGTMGLVRCKGTNLVLLSLFNALEYDVKVIENNYDMQIDRALENRYMHDINYSHVYLDFDDLVIFEGKVNPLVMAFVYQCLNDKVKVHLITRHKEDLDMTLETYRLKGVFDEIIWLKNEEPKHEAIKEQDAIFIDDSYAERQAVSQACKIPVFDAHMIESLIEKF
jgi:hypothetical protein